MLQIYAPYVEHTTVSAEYFAPSPATFAARMEAIGSRFPVLVCEEEGEVLGYAYLAPAFERRAFSWDCDLSVYVRRDARGGGIGSKLEGACARIAKELGYRRIYALVTGENGASVAFHKRAGYHIAAEFPEALFKQGRWMSLIWLEKEVNAPECAAFFPRPLSALPAHLWEEL